MKPKREPLKCQYCGKFLGHDGYPGAVYDEWNGGIEVDPVCGPCGRKRGMKDLRNEAQAINTDEH